VTGLELRGISKAFGQTQVLHEVDLAVRPGEFVALLGPSGCGKSTLMRIVAGIEAADRGEIRIAGADVTRAHPAARNVAMVFQNYALYPHLTAAQNIAVPLAMRRLSAWQRMPLLGRLWPGAGAIRRGITQDVARVAEPLGLAHLLGRKPGQLSGGQRQRVALARAVVRDPSVFLLDEPLSNLDAALRSSTRREIVEIHRRTSAATLYVTHDQAEALTMADRVAVMLGGRILQCGTPREVYEQPADIRVARFLGDPAINLLAAEAGEDGAVRLEGRATGLFTRQRGPLTLGLRPESLDVAAEGWPARVEAREYLGEAQLLHTRVGDQPVTLRVPPGQAETPLLHLRFDPREALLFGADGARVPAREAQHA
jgi:multiple sugar transport system ATP-binding protein